ncbi:c6 zink-finger protein pro1a [Fusarium flagelliforme]|uniref:C6 zink-finger protein pro1a n=1 Tax=Fusarium flagelliforme TaxID=2675880 RepID=A0A395MGJ1_9HYPO|nr:c6 zink-finger protein pro1a [Fusarium flagelliforme]
MEEAVKPGCCWTCKIRHVKCDGATYACLQCTSRQVHCHGYGPMPSWMDGGENEKQERQRIKSAVKTNFKQQKKLQAYQLRGYKQQTRRQAKPAAEGLQLGGNAQLDINSGSQSLQSRILSGQSFAEPLQYDEASLLMHYLDHVFPYQYPCYDKAKWSRGWLLWLLSKNGPLYRASLGLAALHQRSLTGEADNGHLELEFHTKAVRQLQDFLTSIDTTALEPENETLVEIITCGVALISFEVLRGSTADWQSHLYAMTSIAITMHHQPQFSKSPDQLLGSRGIAAIEFHIPVLLWMDLLACVATQEKPKLPYDEWLGPDCTFQLGDIMGCNNSVMKAIGDLAVLSQWKLNSVTGDLDLDEFHLRARQIEDDLETALEATPMVSMQPQVLPMTSTTSNSDQRPNQNCVTRIFAAATLAQLASVSSNARDYTTSTRVRRAVSRVILEIQMAGQTVTPRQLSWPLCVAGCLADQDQQGFFERFLDTVLSEGIGMIGNSTLKDLD